MNLSPIKIQHFHDEGYLVFPGLIHGEKLFTKSPTFCQDILEIHLKIQEITLDLTFSTIKPSR